MLIWIAYCLLFKGTLGLPNNTVHDTTYTEHTGLEPVHIDTTPAVDLVQTNQAITRDTHPINNSEQLSLWTLGVLFKLPINSENCSYDQEPSNLITASIRTSHLLGNKAQAFECWAVRSIKITYVYFFGERSLQCREEPVPVNNLICKQFVAQMMDFAGNSLQQIRYDYWRTNLSVTASYAWLSTRRTSVVNIHVVHTNVTVDPSDLNTILVSNTNLREPCRFSKGFCATGTKAGSIIWGHNLLFGGKLHCQSREYTHQPCLLTKTSLRCPEANLVITSLFTPFRCQATKLGFVRMVLTNNTLNTELQSTNEFVPITSDFDTIYNDTKEYFHPKLHLLAYQLNMCLEETLD